MNQSKAKGGRPRKEQKLRLATRIRKSVMDRYRRFVGTDRIMSECVERALERQMKEEAPA